MHVGRRVSFRCLCLLSDMEGCEETDRGNSVPAEDENDSNPQELPSVWFPCFLVLFSSSVSHIHPGTLGLWMRDYKI